MSLWTPGGDQTPDPEPPAAAGATGAGDPSSADLSPEDRARLESMQAEMAEVREQLLAAPAMVVIANHAMGIYELAAIHLTAETPRLPEVVLAIDALAALLNGLTGRLGDAEHALIEALTQLRAAYLEVRSRAGAGEPAPEA